MGAYLVLALFVALALAVGVVGGIYTSKSLPTWYASLEKPVWNPPNWVFAPVWTFLYISMGVAAWQVWMSVGIGAWLVLYALQLALNMEWTYLFFGERRPDWAFAEIFVLWATILATMIAFWRIDPIAGWLFLPYLLWVTFASTLNGAVWKLNKDLPLSKPTA